jgi:hypothetical protein
MLTLTLADNQIHDFQDWTTDNMTPTIDIADYQTHQINGTLDSVLSDLRSRRRKPVSIVNIFKTRRRVVMLLWNPDEVTRDYWQLSINVLGVNLVYFSIDN